MDILVMFKSLATVERKRNFREASEELLIDQSTLNKRIKRLEAYYNTPLVIRNGKDINITTSGRAILYKYREIEKILNRVENQIIGDQEYQIATTTDIILNSNIKEKIDCNIHVSNDYEQLIKDFNCGHYREILLEDKFKDLINYQQKELFMTIQVGIMGNKSIPNELTMVELLSNYQLVGNEYDPFSKLIAYHIKEELNMEYQFNACSCMQEVIASVINSDDCVCIIPSVLVLPERLKVKIKTIKIKDFDLTRRIYRYKR